MKSLISPIALFAVLAACTGQTANDSAPRTTDTQQQQSADVADNAVADTPPGGGMPGTSADYVMMAGASDLYEIESSRMAQERTQDPAVREFAAMMIEHHTGTTKALTAAARAAGLNPAPPQLMPQHRGMIDELRSLKGEGFDAAYMMQQRRAHDMALELHRNYAANGDNDQLRKAAASAVPVVEKHIARIREM